MNTEVYNSPGSLLHISHHTPCLHPRPPHPPLPPPKKKLRSLCFSFLPQYYSRPKKNKEKCTYGTFFGGNKVYYGRCANDVQEVFKSDKTRPRLDCPRSLFFVRSPGSSAYRYGRPSRFYMHQGAGKYETQV